MYTQPPTPDAQEPAAKKRRRGPAFLMLFVVGVVVAAGVVVGFVSKVDRDPVCCR